MFFFCVMVVFWNNRYYVTLILVYWVYATHGNTTNIADVLPHNRQLLTTCPANQWYGEGLINWNIECKPPDTYTPQAMGGYATQDSTSGNYRGSICNFQMMYSRSGCWGVNCAWRIEYGNDLNLGSVFDSGYTNNPYYWIDLGATREITGIRIWGRSDWGDHRIIYSDIRLGDAPNAGEYVQTANLDLNSANSVYGYPDNKCIFEHNRYTDSQNTLSGTYQAHGYPTGDNIWYEYCQIRETNMWNSKYGWMLKFTPSKFYRYVTIYRSLSSADNGHVGDVEVYGPTLTQCWDCRGQATSPAGSTSQADCTCKAGHYGAWCAGCPNGKYKATASNDDCTACPVGKYTSFWYANTGCQDCPAGWTTASTGSTSSSQCNVVGCVDINSEQVGVVCQCKAGYTGPDNGACTACDVGKYKDGSGSSACTNCPVGSSTTVTGSTSISNCVCQPGYFGANGNPTCSACPAGTYETNPGQSSCTPCPCGTWSGALAATSSNVCIQCIAGTYASNTGNSVESSCTACPSGKYSPAAGACVSDTCANCVAGKYVEATGSDEHTDCVSCACGKYSETFGATSGSTCLACPAGTWSETLGADALNDCIPCTAGYIQPNTGSCFDCVACEANTYSNNDQTACISCAVDSSAPPASDTHTDCVCDSGYTGPDGGPCTACAIGKYQPYAGADPCVDCPVHSTTLSVAAFNMVDCQCNAGYTGPDGSSCVACAVAKYKESVGSETCLDCPVDTTTLSVGAIHVINCECNAGYSGPYGGPCSACADGSYKLVVGSAQRCLCNKGYKTVCNELYNAACVSSCPAGWTGISGQYKCIKLSATTATWANAEAACKNEGGVLAVPENDVQLTFLNAMLDSVSVGGAWVGISDTASEGIWINSYGQVQTFFDWENVVSSPLPQPDNYGGNEDCVQIWWFNRWNDAACSSSQKYLCEVVIADECLACEAGTYQSEQNQYYCQVCPCGTWSQSIAATASSTCEACVAGKYAPGTGHATEAECLECNAGTYSTATEACQIDTCLDCVEGKYIHLSGSDEETDCIDCVSGKYSSVSGANSSDTCQNCPSGTWSQAIGQDSVDDCMLCDPGYFQPDTGSSTPCQICSANTYSNPARSDCTACQPYSSSEAGSSSELDCLCNAGYTGPNGGPCVACEAGKFKPSAGSEGCSECIAGEHSPAGGSVLCLECRAGTFSPNAGASTCTDCPAGTYTPL